MCHLYATEIFTTASEVMSDCTEQTSGQKSLSDDGTDFSTIIDSVFSGGKERCSPATRSMHR